MTARRGQRTPFQVMRHDCELATLLAAARRPIQAELWDVVQVHFPLVVNAYEPRLASLTTMNLPGAATRSARRRAARTRQCKVTSQRSHLSANATNSC